MNTVCMEEASICVMLTDDSVKWFVLYSEIVNKLEYSNSKEFLTGNEPIIFTSSTSYFFLGAKQKGITM